MTELILFFHDSPADEWVPAQNKKTQNNIINLSD